MGSLAKVLSARRKELGLTLLQIAEKMNVSEATVQRWESGNIKSLRHEKIARLADILNVTPAALMGWESYDQNIVENDKLTTITGSELTSEQEELFRLFRAASPEVRAAALTVLRLAEAANKLQDEEEEE